MMKQQVRLLIVDGHRLLRECLELALAEGEEVVVLEPAGGWEDAVNKVKEHDPDVVLINYRLSGASALEVTKELTRSFPHVKIIMYGIPKPGDGYVKYIEAGLRGYVFQEHSSLAELKQMIGQVVADEITCPPEVAYAMFTRLSELSAENWWINRASSMILTPRELEILELIAEGMGNREISEKLFLSLHTIKNHIHKILHKLQVQRRADAVKYAYEKQWLKVKV